MNLRRFDIRSGIAARIAIAVLACALALSTFVSALAIAELHDHDCAGDECPICHVLETAQAVLTLAAPAAAAARAACALAVALLVAAAAGRLGVSATTPVSLKVRLVI